MAIGVQEVVQHFAAGMIKSRKGARILSLNFFRLTRDAAWMGGKELSEVSKQEGKVGVKLSEDSFDGSGWFV